MRTLSKLKEPTDNNDVRISENGLHTPAGGAGNGNIKNHLDLPRTFILVHDIQYTTLFWYVQKT